MLHHLEHLFAQGRVVVNPGKNPIVLLDRQVVAVEGVLQLFIGAFVEPLCAIRIRALCERWLVFTPDILRLDLGFDERAELAVIDL